MLVNFFANLNWFDWIVLAVIIGLAIKLHLDTRKKNKLTQNFQDSVLHSMDLGPSFKRAEQSLVNALLEKVPTGLLERALKANARLAAEIKRLREERVWVKIAVLLHGYQDPYWEKQRPVYAPVLLNLQTGELKAPPVEEQTITGNRDYFREELHGALRTPLGSPRWQYVKGGPIGAILMLGVVYHYRSREAIPV
jgi:hypothetical protein